MSTTAIRLSGVSKRFRLSQPGYQTLREDLTAFWRGSWSRNGGAPSRELWALQDVDVEIPRGETVGVIGANGAGKSTLLKLVAGITRPSKGRIEVHGRTGSLLELGAGLHPELTGRENIFLYGSIMGLRGDAVRARFDQIVEFAGISDFLDIPLKRYSSGMTVRLSFAVAAHVEPDVLLVDELLAVGDARFQQKCIAHIEELRRQGGTIVFVSHNRALVERVCSRALFLRKGAVVCQGTAAEALKVYYSTASWQGTSREAASSGSPVTITGVQLLGADGREERVFNAGDPMKLKIGYRASERVQGALFYCRIFRGLELVHQADTVRSGLTPRCEPGGERFVEIDYSSLALLRGLYHLDVGILRDVRDSYDEWPHAAEFTVESSEEQGLGIALLEHKWNLAP